MTFVMMQGGSETRHAASLRVIFISATALLPLLAVHGRLTRAYII
jgi:hypothetical protein